MQLREFLPKTLFGRMLSIILVPMIIVQVITVFIFYERHWDTVTRHMAANLASEEAAEAWVKSTAALLASTPAAQPP